MSAKKPLMVACPACGRKTAFSPDNRWRPFCSERCKTTDLGAWASGTYVIEGGGPADDEPPQDDDGLGRRLDG